MVVSVEQRTRWTGQGGQRQIIQAERSTPKVPEATD
jgi:hypothetical protein